MEACKSFLIIKENKMEALKLAIKMINADMNGLRLQLKHSNDADLLNKYANAFELRTHMLDYLERYYDEKMEGME
jgi:hypothetical protein